MTAMTHLLAAAIAIVVLSAACGTGDDGSEEAAGAPASAPVTMLELELGESVVVTVSTHSGFDRLELDLNSRFWRATDFPVDSAGNPREPSWPQGVQSAELELPLVEPTLLRVTALGDRALPWGTSFQTHLSASQVSCHPQPRQSQLATGQDATCRCCRSLPPAAISKPLATRHPMAEVRRRRGTYGALPE